MRESKLKGLSGILDSELISTYQRRLGGSRTRTFGPVSRSGFLIWAVAGLLAVMGVLVGVLSQMARQQNAQAHRIYFGEVAQNLAEAGIEHVGRRVRDVLFSSRFPRNLSRLEDVGIFQVLMLDNARLSQLFRDRASRGEVWLQQLLGRGYRYPLDRLLADIEGSTLEITLLVEPAPLVPDPVILDPVEKRVRFILRSTAEHRGVTRVMETGYEIKVVHPFPPVSSKFTLFVSDAEDGQAYNTFKNNTAGQPQTPDDFPPLLFDNTPVEEIRDLTLIRENLPNEETNPFGQMGDLRDAISRRGFIYLGTGTGNTEVHLNMTAGPVLTGFGGFGEFFHFFDPLPEEMGGMSARPGYFAVLAPPPFFQNPVPDPTQPGIFQQANINFLYWGFHQPDGASNLADGTLGSSLLSENSSVLHLFGSNGNPSRTRVYGNVWQDYIRFGYLALDRDTTENDENTQKANLSAGGLPARVRVRDTIDPTLRFAERSEFDEDLRLEASGAPLRTLLPIPSAVINKNFMIGGVVADPGFPTIAMDLGSYRYGRMFDQLYDSGSTDPSRNLGYSRFMSKVEPMPYNAVLDFMFYGGIIPPESNSLFPGPTVKEGYGALLDPSEVAFRFRDPLHEGLGMPIYFEGSLDEVFRPGGGNYQESVGGDPARRSGLQPPKVLSPSPAAEFLLARTYREFLNASELLATYYDPASKILTMDQCVRVREGDLILPAGMAYVGSGLIVVVNGSITSQGITARLDPFTGLPSGLTLATLSGDINFSGGPHQAAFVAPRGGLRRLDDSPLRIDGSLAVRDLAPGVLSSGGVLSYGGLFDPTTDIRVAGGGGYIDYYQIAMSDSPMDWRRVKP